MPQANSTTSWPRLISPSASESTLPCSAVMMAASSSLRSFRSSRKRNSTAVRLASDVSRHSGNASAAAAMTVRASSTDAKATFAVTTPVAGLVTGAVADDSPANALPSHQCCTMAVIRTPPQERNLARDSTVGRVVARVPPSLVQNGEFGALHSVSEIRSEFTPRKALRMRFG